MTSIMMKVTKRTDLCLTVVAAVLLVSCSRHNKELPFGGMKGMVEQVTVTYRNAELWRVNEKGSDILLMSSSVYDTNGYEICSAQMDSAGVVQMMAESLFENGVCVRSTQKSGDVVLGRLSLVGEEPGVLEYTREEFGKTVHMTVRERQFFRRSRTVILIDGEEVQIIRKRVDRKGYPLKIKTDDLKAGTKMTETYVYNKEHDVTENRLSYNDGSNDQITYFEYDEYDDHGNWITARTYNRNNLADKVVSREIEYWD